MAVDGSYDLAIAIDELFLIHFRDKIDSTIGIISRSIQLQPVFLFESLPEPGLWESI
jgi:hypothetical protein